MIVVDVGANDGSLCKYILKEHSKSRVIAVEPNFSLHTDSLSSLSATYPDRFQLSPVAIAEESGIAKLYGGNVNSGQIGSLLPLNQDAPWNEHISSKIHSDDVLDVQTLSVRDFVEIFKLDHIDFLKIDTQGTDLDILEQFLHSITVDLVAVEVEISASDQAHFYFGAENSIMRLMKIASNHGYQVYRMIPVSGSCMEYNVFLAKDQKMFSRVSNEIGVSQLPPFERFWEVLGVGNHTNSDVRTLQTALFKKIFTALQHPLSSYKSVLRKLTS
jgi:FkbM family methyltransferase